MKSKKKKKKKDPQFLLLFSYSTKLDRPTIHIHELFELLYDLWQICAKWLVYYFLYQVDFSALLKWRPGHVPHPPPSVKFICTYVVTYRFYVDCIQKIFFKLLNISNHHVTECRCDLLYMCWCWWSTHQQVPLSICVDWWEHPGNGGRVSYSSGTGMQTGESNTAEISWSDIYFTCNVNIQCTVFVCFYKHPLF